MVVGIVRLSLRLPENHSLKGKRRVLKALIGRVSAHFNVAISETDLHDVWQRSEIGISVVGNSQPVINSILDKVLDFIDRTCLVEVIESDIEIVHLGK